MNSCLKYFSTCLLATAALLVGASPAWAQTAPPLGTASSFAALSGAGLTCTGSAIVGDVGSLLSVTGFPGYPAVLCTINGTVHVADATAIGAHGDVFGDGGTDSALASQACDFNFTGVTELAGLILPGATVSQPLSAGVYCFASAATLSGTLNLTGAGPWIFRTVSTLTTGATSPGMAEVLVDGQANCGGGVFWQIGSSATIGSNTTFVGDILANQSIGFTGTNTSLVGGAFANIAAVTMTGTRITTCEGGGRGGKSKSKCNQGVGNGPENCDPGNSNQDGHGSNPFNGARNTNDELGGTPGNPGRKGGNIK